jgi:hypothetical protein
MPYYASGANLIDIWIRELAAAALPVKTCQPEAYGLIDHKITRWNKGMYYKNSRENGLMHKSLDV